MKPTARKLILDLLLGAEGRRLPARDAVTACGWFGIRENNVRVALVRLSAEGLVEAADRGSYRLGPQANELADEVSAWRTAEQRLRAWSGGYLVVHSAGLGRSDRGALHRRSRALELLGLRELERGLHLRPDNLDAGVDAVRERLHRLGLEREAAVFVASGFDAARAARIEKLWDGKALNRSYRRQREQLEAWVARAPGLDPVTAAREAFLNGGSAIRAVVFDPLLPAPMVDTEERAAFFDAVRRYDRFGHAIWQRVLGGETGDGIAGETGTGAGAANAPRRASRR